MYFFPHTHTERSDREYPLERKRERARERKKERKRNRKNARMNEVIWLAQ